MSLLAVKPSPLPILLIEDEPAVMAYVSATLERSGYHVVCANSGAQGVQLLKTGEFLGVVSDMVTPGGVNGADVHAWISTHRPELAARLVFITGVAPARPAWKNHSACSSSSRLLKRLWGRHCERRP